MTYNGWYAIKPKSKPTSPNKKCYWYHTPWSWHADSVDSLGGAHGVMVIVPGNGHSDTVSNPGRDCLHFT